MASSEGTIRCDAKRLREDDDAVHAKRLKESAVENIRSTLCAAVQCGDLLRVRSLCEQRAHSEDSEAYYDAPMGRYWFNADTLYALCRVAAQYGQVEVLAWLREQYHRGWDDVHTWVWMWNTVEHEAVQAGDLRVLQWTVERNGFKSHRNLCTEAAKHGHVHVLRWLRERAYRWDSDTCIEAARAGHRHVLEWALENHAPCDVAACRRVARASQRADVLRWLRTKHAARLIASQCPSP